MTKTARTHELKILPMYFQAVWDERKTFEVRKNDRGFKTAMYKRLPNTARDVKKFCCDNVDKCGRFIEGGIFERVGAASYWHGEHFGIGKPYSVTLSLYRERENNTYRRKKKMSDVAYITLSQLDTTIKHDGSIFTVQELYEIANTLDRELIKYEFRPTAYELWSDHPDVPYYISKEPGKSLCDIVVTREEAEQALKNMKGE